LAGQLYDPAKRFGPVTRKAANWTTPIDAAIADFSAFKADDANWILDDFVTQEKDAVRSLLNDKAAREKNSTLFKDRAERYVTGEANYKDYVFVFVRDTGQETSISPHVRSNRKRIQTDECTFGRRNV
jgi:hypothetical protein